MGTAVLGLGTQARFQIRKKIRSRSLIPVRPPGGALRGGVGFGTASRDWGGPTVGSLPCGYAPLLSLMASGLR